MSSQVKYELKGKTARIQIDDGKLNLMNPQMLSAIHAAFDRAAQEKAAVVLRGRPNIFSAGFDLKVIRGGTPEELHSMLKLGADLALKVLTHPRPVTAVVEGNAFPMGAFLILSSDWRIAADGDWRIGFNEVQIGIPVPGFALEIARGRLHPAYLSRTVLTGAMYQPGEALAAGFFDEVVAPADLANTVDAAVARFEAMDPSAHNLTKSRLRKVTVAAAQGTIDDEITFEYAVRAIESRKNRQAAQ